MAPGRPIHVYFSHPAIPTYDNNSKDILDNEVTRQHVHRLEQSKSTDHDVTNNHIQLPERIDWHLNCTKLFLNDTVEQNRARNHDVFHTMSPADYIQQTEHCADFKRDRRYILESITKTEEQFPIAFSIVMFKDVEQSERLLRSIYRPQNFYCVHVDNKSSPDIHQAMASIASCFDNVFVTSVSYDVQWGQFSVLEPELQCMKELWKYKWR